MKPPRYERISRLTPEQRVRAVLRCRMISRETWTAALKQFLADPATAVIAREAAAGMGVLDK